MDRSECEVPVEQTDVRSVFARRSDSYWELLSTAAGDAQSLNRTLNGLSTAELDNGAFGSALAPSIVRERVEALSVYDKELLATLALSWRRPSDIGGNPFWVAAWSESLRHLMELKSIERSDVQVPDLAAELKVLYDLSENSTISWSAIVERIQQRAVQYSMIRQLSRSALLETNLSAQDVEFAPALALRLLRGREDILDASARDVIRSRVRTILDQDPLEGALILETSLAFCSEVPGDLTRDLARRLQVADDPRKHIPLAYVVMNPRWRVP